jgi:uncharacterized membrane protein
MGEQLGPVQMLVVGFDEPKFTGEILPELRRLGEAGLVRMLDLLVVSKDDDGNVAAVEISELSESEAEAFGEVAGALMGISGEDAEETSRALDAGAAELDDSGVFDDADVWYVGDTIPNGTTAAIALLEHRWAIPLRDAIVRAGGVALADEWIHPADLDAVGAAAEGQTV